jgi:hypothetical protein
MAERDPTIGRRAAPRLRLSLPGVLLATTGDRRCIVTNLSRTGVLIALGEPLRVDDEGYLRCGPIDHFMIVTRRDRGLNALAFDIPVTDAFVLQMRRFQETFEQRERDELLATARSWIAGENQGRW